MRFFTRQQFHGLFRQIKFVLSLFLIIWILTRSQPLAALEHPAFINFANIAASAPNGIIDLPSRKQTRGEIIRMFKDHMTALKERLNVSAGFFAHLIGRFRLTIFPLQSKLVSGEISLTCDAWQASNSDAYFAVTGHWIEETSPGKWIKQSALFGFTQMNCAHDGRTLGQALYTICQHLNIVSKVTWISSSTVFIFLIIFQIGHITCDNASNNETMLQEFAWCYHFKTGVKFDIKHWHIRWPSNWPLTITTTIIAQCPPQMPCPYSQPRHASIDCQPKFFQLLYSRHNQRRHHRCEF